MILDMSPAIAFFSKSDILLKKATLMTVVDGIWTPTTPSVPYAISGVIQPLRPTELELLPEGARQEGAVHLYTQEIINISGDQKDIGSDLIENDGKVYKALKIYDRTYLGNYFKYVLEFIPGATLT